MAILFDTVSLTIKGFGPIFFNVSVRKFANKLTKDIKEANMPIYNNDYYFPDYEDEKDLFDSEADFYAFYNFDPSGNVIGAHRFLRE